MGVLQRTPYDFLTGVADFWLCYLQKNVTQNGTYTYNSVNDCTFELCGSTTNGVAYDVNPTSTLSFLRLLFSTLATAEQRAAAAAATQSSAAAAAAVKRARQYQDVADNLAPFATGISGSTGQKVFQASYLIAPQPPGGNPLDTYALWPAGTIGLGSDPDTLLVAQNTIKSVDSWAQGNAFPQVRWRPHTCPVASQQEE